MAKQLVMGLLVGVESMPQAQARAARRAYWHAYSDRPEAVRRLRAKERTRSQDRVLQRYKQAKARAKAEGVPFALTKDHCRPAVGACQMCGSVFDAKRWPSIDRRVPALGYVPANLGWLCLPCNGWKYRRSLDDVRALVGRDPRAAQCVAYLDCAI